MDLNIMEINIGGVDCAVVTIEAMVSTTSMAELIFRPLMEFKTPQKQPAQEFSISAPNRACLQTNGKYSVPTVISFSCFFWLCSDPDKRNTQSDSLRNSGLR